METKELSFFVEECLGQGLTSPAEWCEKAQKDIQKIESEIREIELKKISLLREKQTTLKSIISLLATTKSKKDPIISPLSNTINEEMEQLCDRICNFLRTKHPFHMTQRELMDNVASSYREEKSIILAVKYLWDQGVITRDETSLAREISPGINWKTKIDVG